MKITTECYGTKREFASIEEYTEYRLDGYDYGVGQIEATTAIAKNNAKALGRLLDLLVTKGLVTAEETGTVVGGRLWGTAAFESEEIA